MKSANIPQVKLGIVAVSRDCFPIELSQKRRGAILTACAAKGLDVYEAKTTVENEKDMLAAVEEVKAAGCNALTVFLGNFGPETPETLIAKYFDGPCMYVAAAEGDGDLINGRGGCVLRHAELLVQPRDAPPEGVYPGVPDRYGGRNRGEDGGICADLACDPGDQGAEDHHLRGRARRTSSPATRRSKGCMSWVWK